MEESREVLREVTKCYEGLFKKKGMDGGKLEEFVGGLEVRVQEENGKGLIGEISKTEMLVALRAVPANKIPGMDGISIEFYLKFWDLVKRYLLEVFKEIMERGRIGE